MSKQQQTAKLPEQVEQLLRKAITAHNEIYQLLGEVKQSVNKDSTCEDLADIAVALREAETYLKDIRVEVTKQKETTERICCLLYLEDSTRMMRKEPIRTAFVTASPDMKVAAKIPTYEKDPVNYERMMRYLGIDEQLWDRGTILTELGEEHTEVVSVKWPGFTSLCTRLKANGLPLPDGIDPDATYTEFTLRMRKKGELISNATTNDANSVNDDEEIPF